MEDVLQQNLETMVGCPIDRMPESLVERCERIEQLIKGVKPYGGLVSTQVLAVAVASWEAEEGNFARRNLLDGIKGNSG